MLLMEKQAFLGLHTAQVILHSDRNIEATMENILADTGLTGLKFWRESGIFTGDERYRSAGKPSHVFGYGAGVPCRLSDYL